MKPSIKKTINKFFCDLLGFDPKAKIKDSSDQIDIHLELEPKDSGILIGYRGEALTAIQLILSLIYQQQSTVWKPVRLNINDYRQKRHLALESIAKNASIKVAQTGQPVTLTNLTSYERRIIHTTLSDDTSVNTNSQGEPPNRVLVISPTITTTK